MRQPGTEHLSVDELVRTIDDEWTGTNGSQAEAHLAACELCRAKLHELGVLSVRLEAWIANRTVPEVDGQRVALIAELKSRDQLIAQLGEGARTERTRRLKGAALWHWAASACVAAAVVLCAILSPGFRSLRQTELAKTGSGESGISRTEFTRGKGIAAVQTFQVAGETFVALPFSNGDLPVSAPNIVQMEVPVTSLADAGIVFEPVSVEQANPDRAVLADVLLGADGEPLGVHVLAGE